MEIGLECLTQEYVIESTLIARLSAMIVGKPSRLVLRPSTKTLFGRFVSLCE